jgi:hypothetical protein
VGRYLWHHNLEEHHHHCNHFLFSVDVSFASFHFIMYHFPGTVFILTVQGIAYHCFS